MNPVPSVQAILTCEKIIEEAHTGKKTLVNIFTAVNSPGVPVALSMGLYARATDAEGTYEFRLDLVHLPSDKVVSSVTMSPPVQSTDRLTPMEIVIHIPQIVLPEFGKYEFQLYANAVFLAHVSVDIVQIGG